MHCFNFFRNQLWRHLISYNSFRSVNMCSLEVVICEKRRTTISSRRGGAESLRTGGLKHFRTGKKVRTGGLLLLGWGSVPHYMPCRANILCKYITYIFFQFRVWLLQCLFVVISKSFLWLRHFEIIFAVLYFCLYELKECVSDF